MKRSLKKEKSEAMQAVSPQLNIQQSENEVLDFWKKRQIFEASLRSNEQERPQYTFYDGPPFANGLPHYGHLLASTVKDIVPRYWTMRGFRVNRRFGWDCHGFPVEHEVEKNLELKGRGGILEYGVDRFNEACRSTVTKYATEWQETITRLGRWVDWNHTYHTMDQSFMESVWWVFKSLYEKDFVYQDAKIVSFSPLLGAVVSNFEANLNYKDIQDPSVILKFLVEGAEDTYFLAWTTTPWTLTANLALAVHPDYTYIYARDPEASETLIFAKERQDFVDPDGKLEIQKEVLGKELLGQHYEPLFPYFDGEQQKVFQVYPADYVTLDAGTGIVHTAPSFGEDDFSLGKKVGLPLFDPLDQEGKFTGLAPEYQGQFFKDANKPILKDLKDQSRLYRHETFVHSYPHCERTEGPLIYRAIPTWYVRVEKIQAQLIANNLKINWVPEHLKLGRMGKWLENARDWAVSRNRFWGTPLPIWVHEDDPTCIEVIGSIQELEEKTGEKVSDLHKHFVDDLTWEHPKGGIMRRVPEVFDCWFESGSMPYAQIHYPFENEGEFENLFPADFIAEGQDQTRGWFYTLSVISTALFGKPAFKNVVVNGIVLAKDGKKMSKRLKNYTPPGELMDQYGADAVRLYMLQSPILRGEDLRFDNKGVEEVTKSVILPFWNALSFLSTYAAAEDWSPGKEFGEKSKDGLKNLSDPLDIWLQSRLQSLHQTVQTKMEAYKLYEVVPAVLEFLEELTNWYIRLSRKRFWNTTHDAQNLQAFETLYTALYQLCLQMAPLTPFIAEKVYQTLVHGIEGCPESVHLCLLPEAQEHLKDPELELQMALVREAVELGRAIRAKEKLKNRQPLNEFAITVASGEHAQKIRDFSGLIQDELNVKTVSVSVDDGQSFAYEIKPNFKTLGKRLGKRMKELQTALQAMKEEEKKDWIQKLQEGTVTLIGETFAADDFEVRLQPKQEKEGHYYAHSPRMVVCLDGTLTEVLIAEGLAKEIVNRIQRARKAADLNVSDRIQVYFPSTGKMQDIFHKHESFILEEVLGTSVRYDQKGGSYQESIQIAGETIQLGIEKV